MTIKRMMSARETFGGRGRMEIPCTAGVERTDR